MGRLGLQSMLDKHSRFFKLVSNWFRRWWFGIVLLFVALAIRSYQLSSLPVSPYWEEVALAYDSWSILKTGRDHHGVFMPVAVFESYGDWKPSGYFYAVVPFLVVFDLSVLAVRLPAALAGVAIVAGVGVLAYFFWRKRWISYVAMTITSIASWAVLFSRGAWEVNLATAFLTWGMVLLVIWKRKRSLYWLGFAVLLMSASAYTYHAARFVAPTLSIFFVFATLWQWRQSWQLKKLLPIIVVGLVAALINLPWLLSFSTGPAPKRLAETSALLDVSIVEQVNQLREESGSTWWSTLIYHRYWHIARIMSENALSHLNPSFLFISGDDNPRHSTQYFGLLYPLDSILLIFGVLGVLRVKRWGWGLLFWLGVTIFPVSMTKATPHALRILPALPVVMLVLTAGVVEIKFTLQSLLKKNSKRVAINLGIWIILSTAYIAQFGAFWHHYSTVYAATYSHIWQYGYQNLVTELNTYQNTENSTYVSRVYGRPAMYYWFYSKSDPKVVQAEEGKVPVDQGERLEFKQDRLFFFRDENDLQGLQPGDRIVASPVEFEKIKPLYPNLTVEVTLYDLHGNENLLITRVH